MFMATENVLPTSIEQLPTEIFLQIFGFFQLRELVGAFFGLNSHLNSIVRSVNNASHIVQYNDPDALGLLQLFSKQIARLIIVKTDNIDFKSLSNLRSLTLKYTSDAQLKSIRSQYFPWLEILHIYVWPQTLSPENAIKVDDLFQLILNNEFRRLWLCTALGVAPLTTSETWSSSPSLRFLYVEMKTAKDYERLSYTCPNLRWYPGCGNVSVDPVHHIRNIVNNSQKQHIWNALNQLNQLELEGKFIVEVNPFIAFTSKKRQSRSDETKKILYVQQPGSLVVYGRIFPQAEPYCRASFLIEIKFPPEYPFKEPEIIFLDPICHPNIDENGKIGFHWWLKAFGRWKPNSHLGDVIRKLIDIDDQDFSMDSSRNDKPPKDVAEKLLRYLDILYPNGVSINTVTNIERNRPPDYKPEVGMFFGIVAECATDYDYDLVPTYKMTCDADRIARASWTEIKQMLTCLSSAERLSYYNNAYAIEHGRIKWILLRLKELVEQ